MTAAPDVVVVRRGSAGGVTSPPTALLDVLSRSGGDLAIAGAVLVWVPLVLVVDRTASTGLQHLLGLGTWAMLAALLYRESPLVRAQTAVVLVFATAVEYTASPLLEVYVYRLANVPAYVPPGHGLVYLCALALGRSGLFRTYARPLVVSTVLIGAVYAGWGLLVSDRVDALGAFWYGCLVGFLLYGRSRLLYVGAFLVVTYLELLGTALGTWTWQTHDPTGLVPIGNPPSGAAGGYGWFDLAAILAAPALLRAWDRVAPRGRRARRVHGEAATIGHLHGSVDRDVDLGSIAGGELRDVTVRPGTVPSRA